MFSYESSLKRKGLIVVTVNFDIQGIAALEPSRMEKYLAIIKVLDDWDSITQDQIMRKADLKATTKKEFLNFLIKLDLIEEKTFGNKRTYSITDKGQRVIKYFRLNDDKAIFGGLTRID